MAPGLAPVRDDPRMIEPFVDVDWVREHRAEVVLADCRWYSDGRSGPDAYAAGHIPGAVFVDLDTALTRHEDPALGGRHPLADPADFAAAMEALGIGDEDTVIAYDDAGGVIAARLVWMLRATGHEAALLDGGLAAWDEGLDRRRSHFGPTRNKCERTGGWRSRRLEGLQRRGLEARRDRGRWDGGHGRRAGALDGGGLAAGRLASRRGPGPPTGSPRSTRWRKSPRATAPCIDARPAERFAGAPDDLDPRAGHIPGSRSVPCRENLDASGRLLPAAELRARFAVEDAAEVISSCGSGVTACHNLLAMEQAGLGARPPLPRLLVAMESRSLPACTERW